MKRICTLIICISTFTVLTAQNMQFDSIGYIQMQTGKIIQKGDSWVIRCGEGNNIQDYAPVNLPQNMQIENQDVVFAGAIGKIPPNIRMTGTPLSLHSVRKLYKSKPGNVSDKMEPSKKVLQANIDSVGYVKDGKGKISKISDSWVIEDTENNTRYVPDFLPQDFQEEGLMITFSGIIKKSDPNVRIMGKPFTIKELAAVEETTFDVSQVQEPLKDFFPIDSAGYLNETKAFVHKLGGYDEVYYIQVGDTRYLPLMLPKEFAVENLPIYVSGVIGKIPSNVRLAGTPLDIKTIRKG
ncbi:MAG: hypothetical protein ACKVPJ_11810 [Chitinophagales bacterium]